MARDYALTVGIPEFVEYCIRLASIWYSYARARFQNSVAASVDSTSVFRGMLYKFTTCVSRHPKKLQE